MSFLARVEQVRPNEYVLPRVGDMRVDVRAFLSPKLFAETDEKLWAQAASCAATPGALGMYLMPDTHLGYQLPVGGVLVTEDVILQAGSGYDISCGVIYMEVPGLTAEDVANWDKRRWWIEAVERRIAVGVGEGSRSVRSARVEEILRYGGKAIGVSADLCERQYIPVPEGIDFSTIPKARDKAGPQLGSVGGGNHFVEMQVDAADGSVWVMIHCGSRGFGWQAANHFFYEGARLRGLPPNRREESWVRADEPLGKEYWAWHNAAANFAVANRWTIVDGVQEALQEVFKVRAACPHLAFKQRVTWNEQDQDGDFLEWVLEYKPDEKGEMRAYHVRGPDGKYLKRKRTHGEYVRCYDPPHEVFPSHRFPTFHHDGYVVTGDDGTTWAIGSRGNDHAVLRQEIVNNPILWPAEKDELLRWLDGQRKIVIEPGTPPGEAEAVDLIHRRTDQYFCERIMGGLPVTEEEIRASGLDDRTVENLIYNLRNYVPRKDWTREART